MTDAHEQMLDLISDAALDSGLWPTVLKRMTAEAGGVGAMMSRLNIRDGSGSLEFVRPDATEARRAFEHYASKNPLQIVSDPSDYRRSWSPRVLTDEDLLRKSEFMSTEFYNEFMRPLDMHSVMFIRLALHGDDVFAISISRPKSRGGFRTEELAAMGRLHPHLLRAFTLGQKFAVVRNQAQDLSEVLHSLRDAVVIVGAGGAVQHLNTSAEIVIRRRHELTVVRGVLTATSAQDDRQLQRLIATAQAAEAGERDSGTMTLRSDELRLPLSITVSPLRSARDSLLGGGASVMVAITDPEASVGVDENKLRELFGLSPAELRVASAMLSGQSPKEAAISLGVSFFTVRGHLVRIFEKTHTNRQAQLVRLLMQSMGSR